MKASWLLSLLALGLVAGCEEKPATPAPQTNAGAGVLTAPVDYLGAVGQAKQTAVKTVDIASIRSAVQLFYVDRGRYPKDLNELVQEQFMPKIPDAPYGMKLDYDPATGGIRVVKQ